MTATQLSAAAHERLKAELEDLTVRWRAEIAQKIEEARALGDLSENGDYHAAKDEQGKVESRIRQLQGLLQNVEVVEVGGSETVVTGSTVTIRYDGDDEDEAERYLVGNIEEQVEGAEVMSPVSPMGAALLGHRAGDAVTYKTPTGKSLTVHVVAVA